MVQKFLLLSVIIATIAIPAWAARDANPRRGLTKTVRLFVVFGLFYLFALKYLYWQVV